MPTYKDYFLLHWIVLIWGFTAILGKLITLSPLELVIYRTAIATSISAMVLMYYRQFEVKIKTIEIIKMLFTGFLIALHWLLFFGAAKLSASVCLAGLTTATLWTSILEPIIQKRPLKFYEMGLGLVVMLGLYQIYNVEINHSLALFMAMASAFFGVLFSILNARFTHRHHHQMITFYEMLGAMVSMMVFLPFHDLFFWSEVTLRFEPTQNDWIYLFILGGICTVYAYSLSVKLMKKFTPFAVNLTVNLEPVYGIILALLIFGKEEEMKSGFYLGTIIILVAIFTYPFLKKYFDDRRKKKLRKLVEKRRNTPYYINKKKKVF
ncbi:MAG: DMT family transporter [Bacteroidetes bacterium]|nr:MAG: DMT family transporter [Bacteroidota bacterium]